MCVCVCDSEGGGGGERGEGRRERVNESGVLDYAKCMLIDGNLAHTVVNGNA